MTELGILAGVNANNYMNYQKTIEGQFNNNNQQTLPEYLNNNKTQKDLAYNNAGYKASCAESYPLYSPDYVKHQQNSLSGLPGKSVEDKRPRDIRQIGKEEDFVNYIPSNDPTNDQLLDLQERPLTDFYHNNMVPFYGSKITQNMAGTGVASGSYIDGSNVPGNKTGINSGFDFSTPNQTMLGDYTGSSDTYLHKREAGPMFSPAEQQTNWVNGAPLIRPDMDRYTTGLSNIRNDLKPVEAIKVGPGMNLDPSIPASGGFHDFTRILPNNVSDYKANQLSGQVIKGKHFSSGLPTSYPGIGLSGNKEAPGVTKNRPNQFWDQTRLPTMTTKVGFQNNLDYNIPQYEVDFKPNNASRDQISYGLGNLEYKKQQNAYNSGSNETLCVSPEVSVGQGPLGAHISQTPSRSETWMNIDNNIRSRADCNSIPTGNPERSSFGHGNIISNYYVNETDRGQVAPQNVMQLNLSAERQGGAFYTYEDEGRTTTKETTQFAYSGNAIGEYGKGTFYTYDDVGRTTRAETLQFAYAGNATRPDQGTKFWTYNDTLPTTTKETTSFSYAGDVQNIIPSDMSRFQYTG